MSQKNDAGTPEPIAIIGFGCRFPGGADNPKAFWALLREGVDGIVEVPPDRWDADSFYHPDITRPGTAVTRWGGFVRQPVTDFDARFFGMSPREAAHLDPMQRWLLEVSWEAFEDAGLPPECLAGSPTGVFIGVFTEDTKLFQLGESNRELIGPHTGTGTAMTMAANRISYWFDLRGPSVSLDTACSSSLVAVHLACQSLWSGESTLALAGGANAMFRPEFTIAESKAGMLSPDGRCKTFDASANGYVRGEGAGIVVLKPLSAARRDGDRIHAVILGTASNQDGRTQGITVPSGPAQEALMQEAFRRAGVSPGQVRYMEAHGTGTPVGDPIEVKALGAVLRTGRPQGDRCLVGSVKTNIGHLEAAAGVAGLIKAALCLEHREIPPHLHLDRPNPAIPFDELCLRVPRQLERWPEEPGPALAAVNSFGFGGANAHAVLTAPPDEEWETPSPEGRAELVPLSARSPEALRALVEAYRDGLAESSLRQVSLAEIASTAGRRRSHHEHRLALVSRSRRELAEQLAGFLEGVELPGTHQAVAPLGRGRRLAWVFSGMGPQWWGMGQQLLAEEPVFRAMVERCCELFEKLSGWSLLAEMTAGEEGSRMAETQVSQPANFVLQVALATLLRSWGITPDAIVGHSTGEAAAFYAAGVVSLEEAVRIIYHRSRLQHRTTGQGRLVAVDLPLAEARLAIAGFPEVSIAAVNSPGSVTLAGEPGALEALVAPLLERGVFCRFLRVEVPFHSHYMDPLRPELLEALTGLDLRPAEFPLYSTVTGAPAAGPELDAGYWWRNVRETVYFAVTMDRLIADGYDTFLEIGPHPVLTASIKDCLRQRGREGVVLSTLRRKEEERTLVLGAGAALHTLGCPVDWRSLHPGRRRVVDLPLYPWQRERHWDESMASVGDRLAASVHPLLGRRLTSARPAWEAMLDSRATPYLADHRIQGAVVFPGAGYVEMGVAALRALIGEGHTLELEEIRFDKALFLSEGEWATIQTLVDPQDLRFDIFSRTSGEGEAWRRHAGGRLLRARSTATPPRGDFERIAARMTREIPRQECYALLSSRGFDYGSRFQGLERVWSGAGEALACVRAPHAITELGSHHVHPAVLDGCFQSLLVAALAGGGFSATYLPVSIGRLVVHGRPGFDVWAHSRLLRLDERALEGEILVFDEAGNLVMEILGIRAVSLEAASSTDQPVERMLFDIEWQPFSLAVEGKEAPEPRGWGTWMLFLDEGGIGRSLMRRLTEEGQTCVAVKPGEEYGREEDGSFCLDPARPEHFRRLFADISGPDRPPCRGMVHLWCLDAPAPGELDAAALMAAQRPGPIAMLHALQALDQAGWREMPRLWIVTRGAQATGSGGEGAVAVAQAPMWGFARTIFHQENVDLAGGIVDLDPAAPEGEVDQLLAALLGPRGEDQIALRDGRALVPRMVPSPRLASGDVRPRFRTDGTYLVTGGLGGLGLLFARWLVERGACRLILAGRTPLPPRAEWSAAVPGTASAERIAAVRALEAMGASVHLASFDIADAAALSGFLADFKREGWPPIRGVLHAAGVAQPRLLLKMSAAEFNATLQPKLAGGWLLHRALTEAPLDFFIVFASVTGLGFSMGLTDYATANAFLDGLAHYRRALGLPALSIDWGAWGEVGMASSAAVAADFVNRGYVLIRREQGVQIMERLLEHDPVQVVATQVDWPLLARKNYPLGAPPLLASVVAQQEEGASAVAPAQTAGSLVERLAATGDSGAQEEMLAGHVRDTAARVLRLDPARIDPEQPLHVFGLDSMLAIELRNRLETSIGLGPSVVDLLQGASVASLAGQLLPRLELSADRTDQEVAALIAELDGLSPDELALLLEAGR